MVNIVNIVTKMDMDNLEHLDDFPSEKHDINEEKKDSVHIEENKSMQIVIHNKNKLKKGIIYLSVIPLYMNVTRIREFFEQFGVVGRIYMQLAETDKKSKEKSKKKKPSKKFTEGWVEFERKSVAKKVSNMLNNKQVSTSKKSKQYDCIWNIKYLRGFKWTHLNERLAYEKAARRQKLRVEIQLAKKQTNFFITNIDQKKLKKRNLLDQLEKTEIPSEKENKKVNAEERRKYLKSLFVN